MGKLNGVDCKSTVEFSEGETNFVGGSLKHGV